MVTEYKILPYLLNDFQSFDNYKQARKFDFNEIRRNIYLNARDYNNKLPDRYYSILLGQEFEDLDSLSLLLSLGIGKMASSYLELSQNKIYIKPEKLNAWQEFIAEIPPLFLTTQFLLLRLPFYQKINEEIKISDFLKNTISINFRYTVLPQARIPQLSEFIRNIGGLSDLHIHINGTIEAQWVWENALASPDLFCNYISNTNVFKELALQSKGITSTIELRDLLIRSRSLRAEMFKHLMQNDLTEDLANEIQGYVNPFSIFS
ncbi:hypothetical protein [uncultured Sphaerochaeta sp.]|uniref:hypothetical protein n=1 Tax=uncultured Sphaerochaeta sp. TaxID=886478 RepID=UPI002AA7A99B|nr:hypothetical protein [uncultured Sphaerochaeta sp.]